jgi:glutathione S-transferase
MSDSRPTLWHLTHSHYSEKVRWALDLKQVPHVRRAAAVPGAHMVAAMWLTRDPGNFTYPVLEMDGRAIADSTAIIAALEERFPEPALYPVDPEQRQRALELEEYFDEELGPHIRQLAFHELGNDPELFEALIHRTVPGPLASMGSGAVSYARTFSGVRFGARSEETAERSRVGILSALDRLDAELSGGNGEYLVGDSFGIADLTAAALFYPLVLPEGGPVPPDLPAPRGMESFRAPLTDRPGYRWVQRTYELHRRPGVLVA